MIKDNARPNDQGIDRPSYKNEWMHLEKDKKREEEEGEEDEEEYENMKAYIKTSLLLLSIW